MYGNVDQKEGDYRQQADPFFANREKADAANINRETLLATDYLNHLNEIVMTLEMIPDMPEILEEAREWQRKTHGPGRHRRPAGLV